MAVWDGAVHASNPNPSDSAPPPGSARAVVAWSAPGIDVISTVMTATTRRRDSILMCILPLELPAGPDEGAAARTRAGSDAGAFWQRSLASLGIRARGRSGGHRHARTTLVQAHRRPEDDGWPRRAGMKQALAGVAPHARDDFASAALGDGRDRAQD